MCVCVCVYLCGNRSQLPRGLRRRSVTVTGETVGSNHSGALDVNCSECCVLQVQVYETSRSLVQRDPAYCDGFLCDLETSSTRWPWPALTRNATGGRGEYMRLFTTPV